MWQLLNGPLFASFSVFSNLHLVEFSFIMHVVDEIRTADLMYWKQPLSHRHCPSFLKWTFPGLFLDFLIIFFIFSLVHCFYYNWQIFVNGDMKQERRRKSICCSIHCSLEKAQPPARIDLQQFWTKKSQVRPWIQTRLAGTACHWSTAWATTAAPPLP